MEGRDQGAKIVGNRVERNGGQIGQRSLGSRGGVGRRMRRLRIDRQLRGVKRADHVAAPGVAVEPGQQDVVVADALDAATRGVATAVPARPAAGSLDACENSRCNSSRK